MSAEELDFTRRDFLKISATAAGALLVGINLESCSDGKSPQFDASGQPLLVPNAWIRISRDDTVTLLVGSSEMGQGVMTAIPMLIAEELDADWAKVRAEFAPAHADYSNPLNGRQHTGGSNSISGFWQPLREVGAAARALLIETAAYQWKVPVNECSTDVGLVVHKGSNRRLRFGELVEEASKREIPQKILLKDPSTFRILGKPVRRLDTPEKVNGSAIFGQDVRIDQMLTALIFRPPTFGAKVKAIYSDEAKKVAGVRHIVTVDSGVAVVADHTWAAIKGRDALRVDWENGPDSKTDSAAIRQEFISALPAAKPVVSVGNAAAELARAKTRVDAVYEVPFVTHACMEPMNCTAHVTADACEIWAATQSQTTAQRQAARACGMKPEKVKIHTTYLGGGFGRRIEFDFVVEAVQISKAIKAPVKLMWTREDDIRHGRYRPSTYNTISGGVNENGEIFSWIHTVSGPSIGARFSEEVAKSGIDHAVVPKLPYPIPNVLLSYSMVGTPLTVGFWRSVGASQNVYITECFFDELARAAGKDPYELRRGFLKNDPRSLAVLELAAKKSEWGTLLPVGHARGMAFSADFASWSAQVAEVSIEDGHVRVHRVVCAFDCGRVVNPNIVVSQIESGIVFGLSAALKEKISVRDGHVEQGNFDDYPILRFDEMPQIEVHLVSSAQPPGGVGEPGVPLIAPAVANALFSLTGKPVRRLPIQLT